MYPNRELYNRTVARERKALRIKKIVAYAVLVFGFDLVFGTANLHADSPIWVPYAIGFVCEAIGAAIIWAIYVITKP